MAVLLGANACTTVGDNKKPAELYYLNVTKADSEAYAFFRTVYQTASDELAFANIIGNKGGAGTGQLTDSISAQYKGVLARVEELATDANVLIPQPGFDTFSLEGGLDSAQTQVLASAYLQTSISNQKKVIEQFKQVTNNTSAPLRDYAQEVLPTLESTLSSTEALAK